MKCPLLKSVLGLGVVIAALSAIAIIAVPVVYWVSEGFTRWG